MFAPVVRRCAARSRAATVSARSPTRRSPARVAAPPRPVYLEMPTDLLAAEEPAAPPRRAPDRARRRRPTLARAVAQLDDAERPLVWVGGGARDAGAAVAALAERLAAPVLTTYGAAGVLPAGAPVPWSGCRRTSGAAGRLWDEADAVIAVGSDLDGMKTQNWAQPPPAG